MKITIPPAVQASLFGIMSWYVANRLPQFSWDWSGSRIVAAGLAVVGLAIVAIAIHHFFEMKTTINPMNPDNAAKLVTIGIYRVSRNPMYLGMLLFLLAWALFLSNYAALFPPVLFVISMTLFQIKPEEKTLHNKFGPEYDDYSRRVRRWI